MMKKWPAICLLTATTLLRGVDRDYRVIDFRAEPHNYATWQPKDRFAELLQRVEKGEVTLDTTDDQSMLRSLLTALKIPVSSQLLLFSASSLHSEIINPRNPRALFFNEDTYVGYVPGGVLEVAAADPERGPIFYVFDRMQPGGPMPRLERGTKCFNCHGGVATKGLPGLIAESLLVSQAGSSLETYRRDEQGHHIPLENRFGGWHLTGGHHISGHRANVYGLTRNGRTEKQDVIPGQTWALEKHLLPTSDILPHLIHEHQIGFENRLVRGIYTVRQLKHERKGMLGNTELTEIDTWAQEFARYVLFADEAKFPSSGIQGDSVYAKAFQEDRRASKRGLALKDLDMKTRIFKHRCSYMLYTDTWKHAPKELKDRVYFRMAEGLRDAQPNPALAHLSIEERRAIREILKDTMTDLPAWWR
ncbi:MAG: hypothetical protein IPK32_19045 [Verrucomicrobiaceae bacterium]|nr:hypothetical protein [Verrucomicrobiaceae bacterium]